jgi:hypothetical protein
MERQQYFKIEFMLYSKQSEAVTHKRVSKYTGVTWNIQAQKWVSSITVKGVRYECGFYDNDREAAKGRDRKIIALNLNKPLQILKKANQ